MAEGEPKKPRKKTVWKNIFTGSNPITGRPYFERRKVVVSEPIKKKDPLPEKEIHTPLTKEERGNYTADLVAEGMDRRDEEKERNMRKAKGLPSEE